MTIQGQIKQRIDEAEPGTVFFVNDFAEFDNEYVSKLLSTMKGFGVLERLAKGIYYKPIVTNYGNVYPSAEKIVKLIAEHENAEILPTGEYALNALGLSHRFRWGNLSNNRIAEDYNYREQENKTEAQNSQHIFVSQQVNAHYLF